MAESATAPQPDAAGAARPDRRARSRVAGAAEPPRRAGAGGRRAQEEGRLGGLPARARGAGHRRPEGASTRARCKTDSVAPIWREIMSACRALETPTRVAYLGPAGTFSEDGRARLLRLVDRARALRQHRRGVSRHHRRRGRLRRGAGRELDRRRGRALARPVPDDAAVHHRRDQPVRAPQPAAPRERARRHPGRVRAPAGAGAVPRLAAQPPAQRRAPAGGEQCRRRAPGRRDAVAGGDRQRARRQRVRPARGGAGDPGRRPQPHPLRDRHAPGAPAAAAAPRATTAPAWSSRWPTGRAPCTTCWCR